MTTQGEWDARKELAGVGFGVVTTGLGLAAAAAGLPKAVAAVGLAAAVVFWWMAVRSWQARRAHQRQLVARGLRFEGLLSQASATDLGVYPAAETHLLDGGKIPEYVARPDEDAKLQRAVRQGLHGEGISWLIMAVGTPAVGKSRALFEALRAVQDETGTALYVVAPRPGDVSVLDRLDDVNNAELAVRPGDELVLWLDDIEDWLGVLDIARLKEWRECVGGIVVATQGGQGAEKAKQAGINLELPVKAILGYATTVPISRIAGLGAQVYVTEQQADAIAVHGLAAYLIAGPLLQNALDTQSHGDGQTCPAGVALATAAADWVSCGRTDPIPEVTLRTIWNTYDLPGVPHTDEQFATAVKWATRPVKATIALLDTVDQGYSVYPYAAHLILQTPAHRQPQAVVWEAALQDATPSQAIAVGAAAAQAGLISEAVTAFRNAYTSATDLKLRISALYNLSETLERDGRGDEAVAAYEKMITTYGNDPTPAVRAQVAWALVNKGGVVGRLGHPEQAIEVYEQVVATNSDEPSRTMRAQVARALLGKGNRLSELGRAEQAIEVYRQVITAYRDDPAPELREVVAPALTNKGIQLAKLGRAEQAIEVYRQVITAYRDDPTPAIREQVVKALTGEAVALGHGQQAVGVYEQVITAYRDDPTPAIRAEVSRALVNLGFLLGGLGRAEEAVGVYEQVITAYRDDPNPGTREHVATALVNTGLAMEQSGRAGQAIGVYEQVITGYRDDSTPAIREQVVTALTGKGIALGRLGHDDEAIRVFDQVITAYRDDPAPAIREVVAAALINKAIRLGDLDRGGQAIRVYEQVITAYRDDPTPALRNSVATALVNAGLRTEQLGRADEAIAAYEQVITDYRDDPTPAMRATVAKALVCKGVVLWELGQVSEASAAHGSVVNEYEHDPYAEAQKWVEYARHLLDRDAS